MKATCIALEYIKNQLEKQISKKRLHGENGTGVFKERKGMDKQNRGQSRRNNVRYRNFLSLCEGVLSNKNTGFLTRFDKKTDYRVH